MVHGGMNQNYNHYIVNMDTMNVEFPINTSSLDSWGQFIDLEKYNPQVFINSPTKHQSTIKKHVYNVNNFVDRYNDWFIYMIHIIGLSSIFWIFLKYMFTPLII